MLNDHEMLTAEEVALLLRPVLLELIAKHGEKKANEIVKEAAKRLGLNPDNWGVERDRPS